MRREPGQIGCAVESAQAHESLRGTASHVSRWLAIEQDGAWGNNALTESRLAAETAEQLDRWREAARTRVLLIRRGIAVPDAHGTRTAFLARTDRTASWLVRLHFTDPAELLNLDSALFDSTDPPPIGEVVTSQLVLVCTNGRHDPCCATEGRPAFRALSDAGRDVWESSHVGGDRFAANVVLLPSGIYLGRVDPETATEVVDAAVEGRVDARHYRGRSQHPPIRQAAESWLREHLDCWDIAAISLTSETRHRDELTAVFATPEGEFAVSVSRRLGEPSPLTCARVPSRAWIYELHGIRQLS
jgi:hypothetical protein